jgi:hypothetical protein
LAEEGREWWEESSFSSLGRFSGGGSPAMAVAEGGRWDGRGGGRPRAPPAYLLRPAPVCVNQGACGSGPSPTPNLIWAEFGYILLPVDINIVLLVLYRLE